MFSFEPDGWRDRFPARCTETQARHGLRVGLSRAGERLTLLAEGLSNAEIAGHWSNSGETTNISSSRKKGRCRIDWRRETVTLPVADVDRAKHFYSQQVGFNVDHDSPISDEMRVAAEPGS